MMDWKGAAKGMLETERRMMPFHRPPSTGVWVLWRAEIKIGMIQKPVDVDYPAVVFLSITSRFHCVPDFVKAVRNLDPGRLELTADAKLDLTGNFHTLRLEDRNLTFMTPQETVAMRDLGARIFQMQPEGNMIVATEVQHGPVQWKQRPEDN